MCLQRQTGLNSREGIESVPGGTLDCGSESSIPSLCRICCEGGWFLGGNHCRGISHPLIRQHYAIPGSCVRFPSTESPPQCLLARPPGLPQTPCRISPAPHLNLTLTFFTCVCLCSCACKIAHNRVIWSCLPTNSRSTLLAFILPKGAIDDICY